MVLCLHVESNNRGDTALHFFQHAGSGRIWLTNQSEKWYGRWEYSCSTIHVATYDCMITGRSVHNQRIEHLWRDVFSGCTGYTTPSFTLLMTVDFTIGAINLTYLPYIHFVFLDDIQQQVSKFKEAWNHHRMRTCHNQSPLQLWVLRLGDHSANNPDAAVTGLLPLMVG